MTYKRLARDFVNSRKGNFAMLFALSTLPIIASVGLLIEYNNMSKAQAQLQAAVDATALMVGKDYNKTGKVPNKNELQGLVESNFDGEIEAVDARVVNGELFFQVRVKTPALFSNTFGVKFDQAARTTVPLKSEEMGFDIALVLDSTGSMGNDNKMVDLKVVASDFVTDIFEKSDEENFKTEISIVPFAQYVNVGKSNINKPWLQVVDKDNNPVAPNQINMAGGYQWNGCVGSRPMPLNTKDGNYSTPVPGVVNVGCPTKITPVTDNKNKLYSAINALNPSGWTYIGGGVMWGLRTLTSDAPFEEAREKSPTLRKAMIVMTDGDNTRGPFDTGSAWHTNDDTAFIDGQTLTACAEAIRHGIKIYTISFGTSVSAQGKQVMRSCASTPADFYDASNAAALKEAFEAIADDIYRLKLSS